MSKKIMLACCLVFFFVCTSPCFCKETKGWSAKYKVATLAPDGVSWGKQVKIVLLPAVKKVTNGTLTFKVYWGGVMGDDEDYIKKMRIGQLDGAGMSGQGSLLAVPEMMVMELPFLFDNWGEVDHVKTKMAPVFDEIAEKHDYVAMAYVDQDFDRFFSSKYDMSKLEHFSQAKILTWVGDLEAAVLQSVGSTPIPVNMPETPSSIRQGMGNMIIAPAAWGVGTQMYTILKYVSPLKIRYSPGLVLFTYEAFMNMPKEYRDAYFRVRQGVIDEFCAAVRSDNEKCLAGMLKYGVKEVAMGPDDQKEFMKRTRKVWDEQADKLYPEELLEQLLEHLEEYRSAN